MRDPLSEPARSEALGCPRRVRFVILLLGLALGLGSCAVARKSVALRGADDLSAAGGRRYVLPDSVPSEPGQAWGVLGDDSLVIYRPELANERRSADGRTRYRREVRTVKGDGVAISGYRLADGRYVKFEGTVRREGDSLIFEPTRPRGLEKQTREPVRLAAAEVQSIDAWFPSVGNTVLLITVLSLAAALGFVLAIASQLDDSVM